MKRLSTRDGIAALAVALGIHGLAIFAPLASQASGEPAPRRSVPVELVSAALRVSRISAPPVPASSAARPTVSRPVDRPVARAANQARVPEHLAAGAKDAGLWQERGAALAMPMGARWAPAGAEPIEAPRPVKPPSEPQKKPTQQTRRPQPEREVEPEPAPSPPAVAAAAQKQQVAARRAQAEARAKAAAAQQLARAQEDYKARVRALLAAGKYYPRRAQRYGLAGTVRIRFHVTAHGRALQAQVARSSGHRMLDDAAVALVKKFGQLPTPPGGRGLWLEYALDYEIQDR